MMHEIIMAGFGGQGVMSMGQMLTYAAMNHGKQTSWLPSYGPEMRGGTANCTVVVSDSVIGSPVVDNPTSCVVMNRPSLDKFEPLLNDGGLLIFNSSLIDRKPGRDDIRSIAVPANDIANELGNSRVANMVALGAFVQATQVVPLDVVKEALKKVLPPHRHNLIPLNEEALDRGAALVK